MDEKKRNKTNNILLGVCIVLFVVIVGLIIFIIAGLKDKKDEKKEEETTTEAVATELDATPTDAKEDKKDDGKKNFDCVVTVTNSNGWESEGKYCAQLDTSISNKTSSDISNWEVKMKVPSGTSIDSSWNGNFEIKDDMLCVKGADYNLTIAANSEVRDIGVIIKVSSESDILDIVNSASLYVDGKLYVSSSLDEKEDKTTEETTETEKPANTESGTPFDNHGKLAVKGTDLVDKDGNKYQLKGVSTHGLAWFPDYVNKEAFKTFRDDWGANLIRLAMYTDENGGYCNGGNKENLKKLIDDGVNYANELGMYVIIDWHILHDLTPKKYKEEAKVFFEEMSSKYKDYDNVIYEICNEPNGGTSWDEVKSYSEEIIPIIRKNDPDAIIIVGTPNWSQDVDVASENPVEGYDNIMYAIHFYAATHTDNIRNKVKTAVNNGLPVFVSEFSICDASGNGGIDYGQADQWFELIDDLNLSYAGWNVSNKDETSSLIKSSCSKKGNWTDDDYSETGIWLKNQIKNDK